MLESTKQCNLSFAGGTGRLASYNSGYLRVYSGARPSNLVPTGTLLGSLRFGNPAFPTPTTGVAIASALTGDTGADATGVPGYVMAFESDGTTVISSHTVGLAGSGMECILNQLATTAGLPIDCLDFRLTQPPGA